MKAYNGLYVKRAAREKKTRRGPGRRRGTDIDERHVVAVIFLRNCNVFYERRPTREEPAVFPIWIGVSLAWSKTIKFLCMSLLHLLHRCTQGVTLIAMLSRSRRRKRASFGRSQDGVPGCHKSWGSTRPRLASRVVRKLMNSLQ